MMTNALIRGLLIALMIAVMLFFAAYWIWLIGRTILSRGG